MYRILRREGLVKRAEVKLVAGKEYHRKTTAPHQMWATDASYFRISGWGFYYLVTVMDDYSRFILAHRLQRDMTTHSFIEVVQDAVDRTGMDQVTVTDRTRLLSDNESRLRIQGLQGLPAHWWASDTSCASPFHPQTNGKLERYHQTLKKDVNQLPYDLPSDYGGDHRRLRQPLQLSDATTRPCGNVTPSDVLRGRRESDSTTQKEGESSIYPTEETE